MKKLFKKFKLHKYGFGFSKNKFNLDKINFNIFTLLFSALIFRLFISNFGTLQLDHGTYVAWASSLATGGFKSFYLGWSDYLPGYLYVLWILGKINLIFPELQTLMFKLPAVLADLGTGFLIYKIISKERGEKVAIGFSFIYLFNPAIFGNSSLWGQVDSLTAFFSMLSIYSFSYNYVLSAIFLAIGTVIKPQAAFILPSILYLLIKNKTKMSGYFGYIVTGLSVFALSFIPFNNTKSLFNFILNRLSLSSSQYPYGSVNAFSFWGILGFWKPDTITFWIGLGLSVLLISTLTVVVIVKKPKMGEYLLASLSLLITFMFLTRMHERHLLPVLAPLLIASSISPALLLSYIGLSFTYSANLLYAYRWIVDNYKEIFNPVIVKLFIITNLSLLGLNIVSIFKKIKISFTFKIKTNVVKNNFNIKDISSKKANLFLSLILLFSLVTRIYALGIPNEMYFDEIYHSFTAKLVLHNDPKAWEFWNPNPEGYAYEWTHPPLSKLGMTLGMMIFGESPLGWRIPQAILGTLSILLVYLLATEIFKDKMVGILASTIFSLDGLLLVLSRMGMNDTYVLFFSLLSILLFIKDKNILSFIAFGLALSSKWSAVYALPILFISHFVFQKKIKASYLFFIVIPLAIYIASYGVMFKTGHTWDQFVEVQKQMWWYHTNLVAEHPYTSPAWSWPILLRPIYLYDGQVINGLVARIYAFGNPVVFWFGLFSLILAFTISAKEKNKKLGFIVFSYLIFFLPWIASPRIMFLYHYLPSIPFLAIASGFILRKFPKYSTYVLVLGLLTFVYFYPHWTGIRIPLWLDESYYWFPSWR